MARGFTNASSQYLRNASTVPVGVAPLTLACWAYPTDNTVVASMVYLCCSTAAHYFGIDIAGTVANDPFRAIHRGATTTTSSSIDNPTFNAWSHFGGVFSSNANCLAYLNGTAGTASTTDTGAKNTLDGTLIGGRVDFSFPTGVNFMSGNMAEVGIWDGALTAAEMAVLATGVSPMAVRPASLVFYVPMLGQSATAEENDRLSTISLTHSGSPTVQPHPRVFYPARRRFRYGVTAAAGGMSPPFWGSLFPHSLIAV